MQNNLAIHSFEQEVAHIAPPKLFTWPFHYEPHPLAVLAAEQVQRYLNTRTDWSQEISQGKMFGVLVVADSTGEMGFVAAFSGNLNGTNHHSYFVPPVYDMLQPGDTFRSGEAEISAINRRIKDLENSTKYISAKQELARITATSEQELAQLKASLKERKADRDRRRNEGENDNTLILESQHDNAELQRLKRATREKISEAKQQVDLLQQDIDTLKRLRQQRSAELQQWLFKQFRMLNARGEVRNLCELFITTPQGTPPAGAGECAAPKLLQYAYLNNLQPIAMAEFWQGASPQGEVRHHGAYYPACNGKCKPILLHMLEGLNVEPNPLLTISPAEPTILWEDDDMVIINKPAGMLSVDGKSGVRSVETWAHEHYPDATGPMIVHRLDQSTSGILIIAKNKESHKALQEQFIQQRIKKRYTAMLDGIISSHSGRIELPMRLDYDNRPRQMVAPDGKPAITEYSVVGVEHGRTKIHFYPITGRTHQLRLHAAHHQGLNTPIVGDNIYGKECHIESGDGNVLHLHASMVEFVHPRTNEILRIESKEEF